MRDAYERGSGGYCIWHYALPLYVRMNFLHLGFGGRLRYPQGFVETRQRSPRELALEFLQRIAPYEEETYARRSVEGFLALVQSKDCLGSAWYLHSLALTLIMLDRASEARSQLERVLSAEDLQWEQPSLLEEIDQLHAAMSVSVERAKSLLLTWEAEMKERWGIRSGT